MEIITLLVKNKKKMGTLEENIWGCVVFVQRKSEILITVMIDSAAS